MMAEDKKNADDSPHEGSGSSLPPSEHLYDRSDKGHTSNTSSPGRSSQDVKSVELLVEDKQEEKAASKFVHGHVLPQGWMCNYDDETDQYKFEYQGAEVEGKTSEKSTRDEAITAKTPTVDHVVQTSRRPTLDLFECKYGYHFPSSPTPSMISELAKQVQNASGPSAAAAAAAAKTKQIGYGKKKLTVPSDEEEQAKRLREMFPTATAPVVDQMIRIYHGREGLIKAALISLGYKRATEYDAQKATAQSPIMLMMSKASSKKLFEKLVSYFPERDETLIKNLMYKYKEVEHEIISVLVESGDSLGEDELARRQEGFKADKNGAIMKLRYLKFLFPTCEEIELFHMLHCNDLNTQKVIEIVEKRGHKRANIDEVMQNRKSQTQQMRAQQAALAAKEKAPLVDPLEAHRNRTKPTVNEARTNNLKENLRKQLEEKQLADGVILAALEAADYSEPLARKFLEEMEPIDEAAYRKRYELSEERGPDVVKFPCKGVQKCAADVSFMAITCNEHVAIPREVIECTNALALLKVDASTFTRDDFDKQRRTQAKGRSLALAVGSIFRELEVKDSLRRGANERLRLGSQHEAARENRPKVSAALGRNKSLTSGSRVEKMRLGHNPKLMQRVHPFFQPASS